MSSYRVIAEVSKKLRDILWQEFQAEEEIRNLVGEGEVADKLVFTNPTQTAQNSAHSLSLWLYQVTENEYVKNQPPLRGNDAATRQVPPLSLNLSYLITPFASTAENPYGDHLLLGKLMQALYDNASVLFQDPDNEVAEELRIVFCRLSLEELTRVWDALREPYRLSVCYQVRVVHIESKRQSGGPPVVERGSGLSDHTK